MRRYVSGIIATAIVVPIAWAWAASQPESLPGIQPQEQRVMDYMWPRSQFTAYLDSLRDRAVHGDRHAVHAFFTAGRGLDGEHSEDYRSRLWALLFELGDKRFAEALARESASIREYIAQYDFDWLASHEHLKYPRTQALFQKQTSNHTMQPTAGRRTAELSMTQTSYPAATLAFASGG